MRRQETYEDRVRRDHDETTRRLAALRDQLAAEQQPQEKPQEKPRCDDCGYLETWCCCPGGPRGGAR